MHQGRTCALSIPSSRRCLASFFRLPTVGPPKEFHPPPAGFADVCMHDWSCTVRVLCARDRCLRSPLMVLPLVLKLFFVFPMLPAPLAFRHRGAAGPAVFSPGGSIGARVTLLPLLADGVARRRSRGRASGLYFAFFALRTASSERSAVYTTLYCGLGRHLRF